VVGLRVAESEGVDVIQYNVAYLLTTRWVESPLVQHAHWIGSCIIPNLRVCIKFSGLQVSVMSRCADVYTRVYSAPSCMCSACVWSCKSSPLLQCRFSVVHCVGTRCC